jgi:hypothetical protein
MVEASRSPGVTPAMRAIADELQTLEAEVMRVRSALIPHRNKYREDTKAAFRPARRDAARRALEALRAAEDAMRELDVMAGELRRLGGVHPDMKAAKHLAPLVIPLERLAREKGETT